MNKTFVDRLTFEQKIKRCKELGLCWWCDGLGERLTDLMRKKKEICRDCRGTGRDLNLESRSNVLREFHENRVKTLTFSQMIYEYAQLEYLQWHRFYKLTADEQAWQDALISRFQCEFKLSSGAYKSKWAMISNIPNPQQTKEVLRLWSRRILYTRKRQHWFATIQRLAVYNNTPEKREHARNKYLARVRYNKQVTQSRKWRKRYEILFPKEKI
jgi:hypothetical protein